VCGSQVAEVPFGGSKRENSSGAPKRAIHVKTLLNGLLEIIKGTFHLLGLSLSDLKGDCGSIFCASSMVGILVFLSVYSPQRQGSQFWERGGKINKKVFNGPISSSVSVCAVPRGREGSKPELLCSRSSPGCPSKFRSTCNQR
jgi:hypothetical protein